MTDWILQNSLMAGALAIVVALLCRFNRTRPALCHLMWLLVFVTLIAPPLPVDFGLGTTLRRGMTGWLSTSTPEQPLMTAADPSVTPAPGLVAEAWPAAVDLPPSHPGETVQSPRVPGIAERLADVETSTWLWLTWLAGSLTLAVWQLRRILAFQRTLRDARPATPPLTRAVADVAARLDVPSPDVRVVPGVGSPLVWCFGRARLLWPADNAAGGERDDSTLIAHELAHIARNDHWVSRVEALAMVLLWWHPLFWVIRRQVHDSSELSCDAWALWAYPTGRRAYAEALIDAQEKTATATIALQGLCATGRDIKDFERRLRMIMTHRPTHRVSRFAASAAIFATLLVLPGFTDETKKLDRMDGSDATSRVTGMVDAHKLGEKAEALFADKQYDEALAAYREWLELDPENGQAHTRMGYLLIGRGEYEAAEWHLEQQIAAGHKPEIGSYNIACAASLSGDAPRAVEALRHAVQLGFYDAELLANDSDLDAIRAHKKFAMIAAEVDEVAALRKTLWAKEGEEGKELKVKTALAQIVSGDGKLQHDVGLGLLVAGDRPAAIEAFERQAAAGFSRANAYYNIACARALMGDDDSALDALEMSAKLGMKHAAIVDDVDLASLHGDARFEKLSQAIRAPDLLNKKFKAALKEGDVDKAVSILDAITAHGSHEDKALEQVAWGQCELGKAELANGHVKRALKRFNTALASGYAADETVFQMARAYGQAGDSDAALRHVNDALTLGFADPWAVSELVEKANLGDAETRSELVAWAKKASMKKSKSDLKSKSKKKAKKSSYETADADWSDTEGEKALADGGGTR